MIRIHKYALDADVISGLAVQEVECPTWFRSLSAQVQGGQVVMWALVDTATNMVKRKVAVVGTGVDFPEALDYRYVGTAQSPVGWVWHVFVEGGIGRG